MKAVPLNKVRVLVSRVLFAAAILIGGLGRYETFDVADSQDLQTGNASQGVEFYLTRKSWFPNEIRLRIPRQATSHLSEPDSSIMMTVKQEFEYSFVVTTLNREIVVRVNDAATGVQISDFGIAINDEGKENSTYWISVVAGVPSFVRIGSFEPGDEEVWFAEKTLPEPIEILSEQVPVYVKVVNPKLSFNISVTMGTYRTVGDFGVPPTASHVSRVFVLVVSAIWCAKKLVFRRKLSTRVPSPE